MKNFFAFLFISLLSFQFSAFADVYVKSRAMDGMGETETWTSGKKQRMVTHVPMAQDMLGDQIRIVRVDKGVEWEISTKFQVYQETPIALEYKPSEEEKLTPEEQKEAEKMGNELEKSLHEASEAAKNDECSKVVTVPEGKAFAGIPSHGYQSACKPKDAPVATVWLSDDGQPKATQAQKEIDAFEKAVSESRFSKYPEKDNKLADSMLKLIGVGMSQGLMGMPNAENLPKNRFAIALQSEGQKIDGTPGNIMMYETTELRTEAVDASLFEIPEGYKKVDNLAQLQNQALMDQFANGDTKLSDVLSGLTQTAENMGMPQDADTLAVKNKEGMEEADQFFQGAAQFVKEEAQLQGAVSQNAAPSDSQSEDSNAVLQQQLRTTAPEPWQQGLYDQRQTAPPAAQQTSYAPNAVRENNVPQQQGYYPPARQGQQRRPQQNNTQQTLQQVNQILQNVQGIAAQFSGAGAGFGGMQGYEVPEDYSGGESYDDYSDQSYEEESYENAGEEYEDYQNSGEEQ